MSSITLAILAHTNRPCLEDMVKNFQMNVPEAKLVLFNGGTDHTFWQGLDVSLCPYSQPLHYGTQLHLFHFSIMRWLYESRQLTDYLVTCDSDMLFIKPGLVPFLDRVMRNSAYMGSNFQQVLPGTPWDVGRRFLYKWRPGWQQLFQIEHPYGSFNPGQVFRAEFIERLMRYPQLDELLKRMRQTQVRLTEEIIYATLAVAMDCAPMVHPGSHAIRLSRYSPAELAQYRDDPNVYYLHKVGMTYDAPDRVCIRELCQGKIPNVAQFDTSYLQLPVRNPMLNAMRTRLIDLYCCLRSD